MPPTLPVTLAYWNPPSLHRPYVSPPLGFWNQICPGETSRIKIACQSSSCCEKSPGMPALSLMPWCSHRSAREMERRTCQQRDSGNEKRWRLKEARECQAFFVLESGIGGCARKQIAQRTGVHILPYRQVFEFPSFGH